MAKASHTPGPWIPERSGETGRWKVYLGRIHWFAGYRDREDLRQQEADARLIAAAPDLLAVCKRFVEFAASGRGFSYPIGSLQEVREAVSKAEGRS